jgi:hypothetical protein
MRLDVTPCSLVDVTDVSEERTASILKVENEGSTFLRIVGNDIPDNTSKNIITFWFLIVSGLGQFFFFCRILRKGGGDTSRILKTPLKRFRSVCLFCFDSSTEMFSVPFAHWAGDSKPGLVFKRIQVHISTRSLAILNFSVCPGKWSYATSNKPWASPPRLYPPTINDSPLSMLYRLTFCCWRHVI